MESDEQSDGQSYQLDLTPVEDDVKKKIIVLATVSQKRCLYIIYTFTLLSSHHHK